MKKNIIILISSIIVFILCMLILIFLWHSAKKNNTQIVGEFSLTDYQWEIQTFSTEQNVGYVKDKTYAINSAKQLWLEKYNIDISNKKIRVSFDSIESCWHVYTIQSPNVVGGVFHAIIHENGDVLAVWPED